MKKLQALFLMAAFLLTAFGSAEQALAKKTVDAGSVVKGKGLSTVYYVGEDGKRYVFPNDKIYFSWYDDFSKIQEIDMERLIEMPLGGNVRYKPGALLVKIQTDPKVYAVGENGKLRWVKTEAMAKALYGANWNKLVDDVPDSFFTNYTVAEEINEEADFEPAEAEEEVPTPSHNRGWREKLRKKAAARYQAQACVRLENAVNRLQKRLERWGMEMPDVGDDFLEQCVGKHKRAGMNKVAVCHVDENGSKKTIYVGKPAARAHLAHGDALGECSEETGQEEQDTTAPEISEIETETGTSTATITWTTDEPANAILEYSTLPFDNASGTVATFSNNEMTTSHVIELDDLQSETTYYFRAKSADAAGNVSAYTTGSFITLAEADTSAPVISAVAADARSTAVKITWITDEPATSKVIYAEESISSSTSATEVEETDLVTSHEIEITGLATSTDYFFKVESKDAAGNTTLTEEHTFDTL